MATSLRRLSTVQIHPEALRLTPRERHRARDLAVESAVVRSDVMSMTALFLAIVASVVTLLLIAKFWPRSGKMGINLKAVQCPSCGAPQPAVRVPRSLREVLWGGWTCSKCRCQMDKYGASIEP